MMYRAAMSNPFENMFVNAKKLEPIVHGNAQSFSTSICQMSLHRLPKGASLPKQSHHLARWILIVRGNVQMMTGTSVDHTALNQNQSVLLHSYKWCDIRNQLNEEAWVIEFAFLTLDPIAAPAVRMMSHVQEDMNEQTKKYKLPDWILTSFQIGAGNAFLKPTAKNEGHYLYFDLYDANDVSFVRADELESITGGTSGKYVFHIQENVELWS